MDAGDKRLDRMDRLSDMAHFPAVVNAGATLNVALTMLATWWVQPRWPGYIAPWVALVLLVNLTPVLLLRLTLRPDTPYPTLRTMNFYRDQHKFSDWVYVAASADMMVWVLVAWSGAALLRTRGTLGAMLAVAIVTTFSPVLLRALKRR